jgi:hypothetical protein
MTCVYTVGDAEQTGTGWIICNHKKSKQMEHPVHDNAGKRLTAQGGFI